jgi:hypothetical protein
MFIPVESNASGLLRPFPAMEGYSQGKAAVFKEFIYISLILSLIRFS